MKDPVTMNKARFPLFFLMLITASMAAESHIKSLWFEDCSRCHAADGSGMCPLGKSLKVKNYTTKQSQSEFTDTHIEKLLLEGKVRDNKKVMPAYKLADADIKDMTKLIRSLVKE